MVIRKRWKIKENHIYMLTVLNTSIVSLTTLRLTDGCLVSLALYAGVGSTLVMVLITNVINDRIERTQRKKVKKNEDES